MNRNTVNIKALVDALDETLKGKTMQELGEVMNQLIQAMVKTNQKIASIKPSIEFKEEIRRASD